MVRMVVRILVIILVLATGSVVQAASGWSLIGTPSSVEQGQQLAFSFRATDTDGSGDIACVIVIVPSAFSVQAAVVTGTSAGGPWTATRATIGSNTRVKVFNVGGGAKLKEGDWVDFTITATGLDPGSLTWTGDVTQGEDCNNAPFLAQIQFPVTVVTTPTPTPSPTPSSAPTPTPSTTPTLTPSPRPTATPTPRPGASATPSPTPTPTPTPTPRPTATSTPTPGASATPSPTTSPRPTATPTPRTATHTPTPTGAPPPSASPSPSSSPAVAPSPTVPTPPLVPGATSTPAPSDAPSPAPTPSTATVVPPGNGANDGPGPTNTGATVLGPIVLQQGDEFVTAGFGALTLLGDGYAWFVPTFVAGVPGVLLIVILAFQLFGGMIWTPSVRRLRSGSGDVQS